MPSSVQYPCFPSGEPRRISASVIAALAAALRTDLFGAVVRPLDVPSLTRRTANLSVNGTRLRIAWDCAHAVHDCEDRPVLGICEHDPEEPGTVFVSVNGTLLEGQPELMRSTAVHELGHAIFDMPAAVERQKTQTFSSRLHSATDELQQSWREWRADEFMGAFLAPRHPLARAFARCLRECGAEPRWRLAGDSPSPFVRVRSINACAFDAILDSLAEQFGVSQAFIGIRLKKYGFIH